MQYDSEQPGGPDRDEFLRVWRRVSPTDRPDSPISVYDAPPPQDGEEAFLWMVPGANSGGVEKTAGAALAVPPRTGETGMVLEGLLLRERMEAAALRALAKRMGGHASRLLAALAARSDRSARLLEAEGFLLTGARYRPQTRLPKPRLATDDLTALRECYLQAQAAAAAYTALAERAHAPGFAALCHTLEKEKQGQMKALRDIILIRQ